MVKQLQTGSISLNFDGLKKRESINNRIDGFPVVQTYLLTFLLKGDVRLQQFLTVLHWRRIFVL